MLHFSTLNLTGYISLYCGFHLDDFQLPGGVDIFPFTTMSRPGLGTVAFPCSGWYSLFPWKLTDQSMDCTTHLHLMLTLENVWCSISITKHTYMAKWLSTKSTFIFYPLLCRMWTWFDINGKHMITRNIIHTSRNSRKLHICEGMKSIQCNFVYNRFHIDQKNPKPQAGPMRSYHLGTTH